MQNNVRAAFELAAEQYQAQGVDVGAALEQLSNVAISVHCWQGDDVAGFEGNTGTLGDGLAVTGNYPGRARTADELRSDLEVAYSLIPGKHRLNLHALYGEFDGPVDRDEIGVEHFQGWMDWSRDRNVDLDFNPSYFSHSKASDGFTLAHADARGFVSSGSIMESSVARIAAAMGAAQGNACINNFWVPDGYKDTPASRKAPRERLAGSLDAIFADDLPREPNARCGRMQAVWDWQRELCRRFA